MGERVLLNINDYVIFEDKKYIVNSLIGEGATWVAYAVRNQNGGMFCLREYYPLMDVAAYTRGDDGRLYIMDNEKWDLLNQKMQYVIKHEEEIICQIHNDKTEQNIGISDIAFYQRKIESVKERGVVYFLSEMVRGRTLQAYLNDEEERNTEEGLNLLRELGQTIKIMHGLGVLHLDLKPQNLYLRSDLKHIRILDFGSAIQKGKKYDNDEIRNVDLVMYTDGYETSEQRRICNVIQEAVMSKDEEDFENARCAIANLTERCDIYAYLCISREVLMKLGLVHYIERLNDIYAKVKREDIFIEEITDIYRTELQQKWTVHTIKNESIRKYQEITKNISNFYRNALSPIEYDRFNYFGISREKSDNKYLFYGRPETGKSALLYKTWEWCLSKYWVLPIYIDFSTFEEQRSDVNRFLKECMRADYGVERLETTDYDEVFYLCDNVPEKIISALCHILDKNYIIICQEDLKVKKKIVDEDVKEIYFGELSDEQIRTYMEDFPEEFKETSLEDIRSLRGLNRIQTSGDMILLHEQLKESPFISFATSTLPELAFKRMIDSEQNVEKKLLLVSAYDYYLPDIALNEYFRRDKHFLYPEDKDSYLRQYYEKLTEYGVLKKIELPSVDTSINWYEFTRREDNIYFLAKAIVMDYQKRGDKSYILTYPFTTELLGYCYEVGRWELEDISKYLGQVSQDALKNIIWIMKCQYKDVELPKKTTIKNRTWSYFTQVENLKCEQVPIFVNVDDGEILIITCDHEIRYSGSGHLMSYYDVKIGNKYDDLVWWSKGCIRDLSLEIPLMTKLNVISGYRDKNRNEPIYIKRWVDTGVTTNIWDRKYSAINSFCEYHDALYLLIKTSFVGLYFICRVDKENESHPLIIDNYSYTLMQEELACDIKVGEDLLAIGYRDTNKQESHMMVETFEYDKRDKQVLHHNDKMGIKTGVRQFDVIALPLDQSGLIYLNSNGLYMECAFLWKNEICILENADIVSFCLIKDKTEILVFLARGKVMKVQIARDEIIRYKNYKYVDEGEVDLLSVKPVSNDDTYLWFRLKNNEDEIILWHIEEKNNFDQVRKMKLSLKRD